MTDFRHAKATDIMRGGVAVAASLLLLANPTRGLGVTEGDVSAARDEAALRRSDEAAAEGRAGAAQAEIDRLAQDIAERQEGAARRERALASMMREGYKGNIPLSLKSVLLSAENPGDAVAGMRYADMMRERLSTLTRQIKHDESELRQAYDDVSALKDEQEALSQSMHEQAEAAEGRAGEMQRQLDEDEAKRKAEAEAAAAAASSGTVAPTFETGSTDGWRTGVASAYGGWSDPSTGAVSGTATGDVCDDWSMGVAVPMAWPDYRSYFGRQVEISYDGQSVVATVNDCGYMGGGSRSLDLQPGVFKAFGFSDCDSWGLRTVSYRFL